MGEIAFNRARKENRMSQTMAFAQVLALDAPSFSSACAPRFYAFYFGGYFAGALPMPEEDVN